MKKLDLINNDIVNLNDNIENLRIYKSLELNEVKNDFENYINLENEYYKITGDLLAELDIIINELENYNINYFYEFWYNTRDLSEIIDKYEEYYNNDFIKNYLPDVKEFNNLYEFIDYLTNEYNNLIGNLAFNADDIKEHANELINIIIKYFE